MLPDLAALRGCRLEQQKHKCICKASRSFPTGGKGRDTEERFNITSKRKDELLSTVLLLNPKINWTAKPIYRQLL